MKLHRPKREVVRFDDWTLLILSEGSIAVVDADSGPEITERTWSLNGQGYAVTTRRSGDESELVYLHREILKPPADRLVDYVNRNKLDNRRANLRVVTSAENAWNSQRRVCARSGYSGVYAVGNRFRVELTRYGRRYHLGTYCDATEAAAIHMHARQRLESPFAGKQVRADPLSNAAYLEEVETRIGRRVLEPVRTFLLAGLDIQAMPEANDGDAAQGADSAPSVA